MSKESFGLNKLLAYLVIEPYHLAHLSVGELQHGVVDEELAHDKGALRVTFGQIVDGGKCNDGYAAVGRNLETLPDRAWCDNKQAITLQRMLFQVLTDSYVTVEAKVHHGKLYFKRVG